MSRKKPCAAPLCPYCGREAVLVDSQLIYGPRDFGKGWAWLCQNTPCDAYVGCHPGTRKPLGRLANKELRRAKIAAHAAFDRLWHAKIRRDRVSRSTARSLAYQWLAAQLGIEAKDCHIGMFDVAQCKRVVEVCAPYLRRKAA